MIKEPQEVKNKAKKTLRVEEDYFALLVGLILFLLAIFNLVPVLPW